MGRCSKFCPQGLCYTKLILNLIRIFIFRPVLTVFLIYKNPWKHKIGLALCCPPLDLMVSSGACAEGARTLSGHRQKISPVLGPKPEDVFCVRSFKIADAGLLFLNAAVDLMRSTLQACPARMIAATWRPMSAGLRRPGRYQSVVWLSMVSSVLR